MGLRRVASDPKRPSPQCNAGVTVVHRQKVSNGSQPAGLNFAMHYDS